MRLPVGAPASVCLSHHLTCRRWRALAHGGCLRSWHPWMLLCRSAEHCLCCSPPGRQLAYEGCHATGSVVLSGSCPGRRTLLEGGSRGGANKRLQAVPNGAPTNAYRRLPWVNVHRRTRAGDVSSKRWGPVPLQPVPRAALAQSLRSSSGSR